VGADDSVRFAVIGDTGSGNPPQYQVAERLTEARAAFPFEFVLMLGDNLYGLERPVDYQNKFERPYAKLLEDDVEFYASLGNHDNSNQRFYEPFNMGGERYYAFVKGDVKFLALDSNYMDETQLAWLIDELDGTTQGWKIAFFHHPIYSSGAFHGSEVDLRERLEPIFVKYGVRVVFSGHEHFYERIKPQKGVYYFIAGGSARLRRANIKETELTAKGFDTDNSFVLVEIHGDTLRFEAVSRRGELVEAGQIARTDVTQPVIDALKPESKPGPKQGAAAETRQAP
jgi:3',5'-cyclic AMP phosphodiesterase CpdA